MARHTLPAVLGTIVLFASTAVAQLDLETITRRELEHTGAQSTGAALALARPDLFSNVDSVALVRGLPALTLLNGRRFASASDFGGTGGTLDVVPVAFLSAVNVQKTGAWSRYGTEGPGGVVDLRTDRFYTGGEIGVFYGRSTGKYGREDYSAHIIGGVGNDKFNITAGAYYQESTAKFPRRGDRN